MVNKIKEKTKEVIETVKSVLNKLKEIDYLINDEDFSETLVN